MHVLGAVAGRRACGNQAAAAVEFAHVWIPTGCCMRDYSCPCRQGRLYCAHRRWPEDDACACKPEVGSSRGANASPYGTDTDDPTETQGGEQEGCRAMARLAVGVAREVGRAQQRVHGRPCHPRQRGGRVDGHAAPRLAQAAEPPPRRLAPPLQRMRLRAKRWAASTVHAGACHGNNL